MNLRRFVAHRCVTNPDSVGRAVRRETIRNAMQRVGVQTDPRRPRGLCLGATLGLFGATGDDEHTLVPFAEATGAGFVETKIDVP